MDYVNIQPVVPNNLLYCTSFYSKCWMCLEQNALACYPSIWSHPIPHVNLIRRVRLYPRLGLIPPVYRRILHQFDRLRCPDSVWSPAHVNLLFLFLYFLFIYLFDSCLALIASALMVKDRILSTEVLLSTTAPRPELVHHGSHYASVVSSVY